MIAGTVALTAAVVASLCLYQGYNPTPIAFYGASASSEKQIAFLQFLAKYGKTYASKSDMNSRFDIFSKNLDLIQAHNNADVERYKMGINRFTDMTIEEFNALYGTHGVKPKKSQKK